MVAQIDASLFVSLYQKESCRFGSDIITDAPLPGKLLHQILGKPAPFQIYLHYF